MIYFKYLFLFVFNMKFEEKIEIGRKGLFGQLHNPQENVFNCKD